MSLTKLNDIIDSIQGEVDSIIELKPKMEKGVKKAFKSSRKHFSNIARSCKEARKLSLELTKKEED